MLREEAFMTVFILSNILLYWKADLHPVPLLLRVTIGQKTRRISFTDFQEPAPLRKWSQYPITNILVGLRLQL